MASGRRGDGGKQIQTSLEILLTPVARLLANLNARTFRFVSDTWSLMLPYSARSIRRRKWRAAVMALCVALTVLVFVLSDSYYSAAELRFRGQVEEIPMIADLVAARESGWSAEQVHRLNFIPEVRAFAVGSRVRVYSPLGYHHLIGLEGDAFDGEEPPGAGFAQRLELEEGRLPAAPGEILLPAGPARSAGLGLGYDFDVEWPDSRGILHRVTYQVCGLFHTDDPFLGEPVTRLAEADAPPVAAAVEAGANFILLSSGSPGEASRKVGGFLPGGRVISRFHGQQMAGGLLSGVFSTGRIVIILIMLFCSLGVLNVLLLAFLERQRVLGIFKALGTFNDEVRMMLLQEGFLTAFVGIIAGTVGTWIVVTLLNRYTLVTYVTSVRSFIIAGLIAVAVFYVGAALPSGMARNMTVQDLLHRRRII